MAESKFKRVGNIAEYVRNGVKNNEMPLDEVAKFARIKARQGKENEEIVTKMANGLEETRNTVKLDEKTGQPGWIVTNPDGEEYIVEDSVFQKKYEIDPENPEQFKPKGGPVHTAKISENIVFEAPWGGDMNIEAGGSLVINSPEDIYGIQKNEFENTYASTGKDKETVKKEVAEILGIELTQDISTLREDVSTKKEKVGELTQLVEDLKKQKAEKEKELYAREVLSSETKEKNDPSIEEDEIKR